MACKVVDKYVSIITFMQERTFINLSGHWLKPIHFSLLGEKTYVCKVTGTPIISESLYI